MMKISFDFYNAYQKIEKPQVLSPDITIPTG